MHILKTQCRQHHSVGDTESLSVSHSCGVNRLDKLGAHLFAVRTLDSPCRGWCRLRLWGRRRRWGHNNRRRWRWGHDYWCRRRRNNNRRRRWRWGVLTTGAGAAALGAGLDAAPTSISINFVLPPATATFSCQVSFQKSLPSGASQEPNCAASKESAQLAVQPGTPAPRLGL